MELTVNGTARKRVGTCPALVWSSHWVSKFWKAWNSLCLEIPRIQDFTQGGWMLRHSFTSSGRGGGGGAISSNFSYFLHVVCIRPWKQVFNKNLKPQLVELFCLSIKNVHFMKSDSNTVIYFLLQIHDCNVLYICLVGTKRL